MKKNKTNLHLLLILLALTAGCLASSAAAQTTATSQKTSNVNTTTKITYHGGPLMTGTPAVYFIWYGCWDGTCGNAGNPTTQSILEDFAANVGGSPYFQINAMYPNMFGQTPSGALLYGGSVVDRYSHGMELTQADIAAIVADQLTNNGLPQDPSGIYVVLASADVGSTATSFCVPSALAHHGTGYALGSQFQYAFLGNPKRCPSIAAPQFFSRGAQLPTPNGDLAADGMASTMVQLLSEIVTNPTGGGWFDRYGLENAAKCVGQFGTTYATSNGARANLKLGGHDYLIQQNWVNDRKPHCAMNMSL
jgi:Phosphate-induced protein 1 conserved region